ncbi:MAG: HPr(Ser) kinase/phosphatase [Deltaproteobacteria bacterium]|nr:HPr(Ser) kinase/phosphatase [Deltaproteobacteria bacterium]
MASQLRVQDILDEADKDLGLHVLAGRDGLSNVISIPRIQEPGLALAGFRAYMETERVQLLGKAELAYLKSLTSQRRSEIIEEFCGLPLACIIVTYNLAPPRSLLEACESRKIPLLRARLAKARIVSRLTRFLEEKLADRTRVHGVLVDVFGLGILLQGKSGVGKSEAALDLVARGHRLVADDVVEIRRVAHKRLLGMPNSSLGFHMEIRGLGIINVLDLYGATSTRERMPIDLIVHLVDWGDLPNPDRTGLEADIEVLLDVEIPKVHVPVKPGRNLATIIEVASRNEILKKRGTLSAQTFNERLLTRLRRATPAMPDNGSTKPAPRAAKQGRAAGGRGVKRAAKSGRGRKRGKP